MKINGLTYLIVGIFVIITSLILDKFIVFIFVGFIFCIMGVIRLFTETKIDEELVKELKREDKFIETHGKDPSKFIKCKFCKAYNYPDAQFCHFCGRRIN